MKSLTFYASQWAKLNALAHTRNIPIRADLYDSAYRAYVEGDSKKLRQCVSAVKTQLEIPSSKKLNSEYKKLSKTAKRDSGRLAFVR